LLEKAYDHNLVQIGENEQEVYLLEQIKSKYLAELVKDFD